MYSTDYIFTGLLFSSVSTYDSQFTLALSQQIRRWMSHPKIALIPVARGENWIQRQHNVIERGQQVGIDPQKPCSIWVQIHWHMADMTKPPTRVLIGYSLALSQLKIWSAISPIILGLVASVGEDGSYQGYCTWLCFCLWNLTELHTDKALMSIM